MLKNHSINGFKYEDEYSAVCKRIVDELVFGADQTHQKLNEIRNETAANIRDIL